LLMRSIVEGNKKALNDKLRQLKEEGLNDWERTKNVKTKSNFKINLLHFCFLFYFFNLFNCYEFLWVKKNEWSRKNEVYRHYNINGH
jgi:antibiotic biosynthesis monooxygenase (ABM) superfamily enzyme